MRQLIIDVWLSEFAIGVYVGLVSQPSSQHPLLW
jgi:hypothetical protein